MSANVIAIVNQKGGVGKTTTCSNLGIGLARNGKRVMLIDCDPQASLTISLGHPQPDRLPVTLTNILTKILKEKPLKPNEGILHHDEGIDYMPSSIELSDLEVTLVSVMMDREKILKEYIDSLKPQYDCILIDCMPSLGMLTINALAAANSVLIPVQTQHLPAKGLEQLLKTISKVHRKLNPDLHISGILLTMVDYRTNYGREVSSQLHDTYGDKLRIFVSDIPQSVRAAEVSFCKKILKHEARNYFDEVKRQQDKETLFSELSRFEEQKLAWVDDYPSDGYSFNTHGYDISIKSTAIAEAILALSQEKRDIILLAYFLEMSDKDISRMLNLGPVP